MTIRPWRKDESGAAGVPNIHVLVRGRVKLPPGRHTLRLSACGCYHAWLDGEWLGQGPAPAGPDRRYYREYSVEGGRTVTLALLLCGRDAREQGMDGRLALWAEFVRHGRAAALCGGDWRYQICRAWADAAREERFDSRRWPQGWEQPRFDGRGWARLLPAGWAGRAPSPQPAVNLCREKVEPAATRAVPGGIVLDFGRALAGTVHASARGRTGERLALRFGGELDEAGRVRPRRWEDQAWTLAEGESVLYQHDCRDFRYIEVLGLEDGRALTQCWAWERRYPMPEGLCTLSCAQDQLEDIFQASKNAVRRACQESYLALPAGEGAGRWEDMAITARAQVWLSGKTDLLRQCVRNFAVWGGEEAGAALLFPTLPLTDYDFTGDREFLRECWPAVKAIADRLSRYQRPDGLLENVPCGCREDGCGLLLARPEEEKGCRGVVNALWCGFLQMKERMERLLGLPRTEESRRAAAAFLQTFWRWERKLFADGEADGCCSLEVNACSASFGLTPSVGADAYERLLLGPGRRCGPLPMYFALRGLGRMGKGWSLYRLLVREGAADGPAVWGEWPGGGGAIPLIIEELAGLRPDPDWPMGLRFRPRLPAKLEDFALQAPVGGQLARVEQREWRAAMTVRPLR